MSNWDKGHKTTRPRCPVCREHMFFSSRSDELICDKHGAMTGIMWGVLRYMQPFDALLRLRVWQAEKETKSLASRARMDIGIMLGGMPLPSLNYPESPHEGLVYRSFAGRGFLTENTSA